MKCKKCGMEINEIQNFCPYCGSKIYIEKKKGFWLYFLVGLFFPIIGLILFLINFRKNKNAYAGLITSLISLFISVLVLISIISRINFNFLDSTIKFKSVNDFSNDNITYVMSSELEVDEYVYNNEGDFKIVDTIDFDGYVVDDYYGLYGKLDYTITFEYEGRFFMKTEEEFDLKVKEWNIKIDINNEVSDSFKNYLKDGDLYSLSQNDFDRLLKERNINGIYEEEIIWSAFINWESMSFYYYKINLDEL